MLCIERQRVDQSEVCKRFFLEERKSIVNKESSGRFQVQFADLGNDGGDFVYYHENILFL